MGNRKTWCGIVGALAALATGLSSVLGAVANLPAVKDADIFGDSTSNADGAGPFMRAGATSGGAARRALVQFDLTTIPAGSTITAATLTLYSSTGANNNTATTPVKIYKITQSWSEGPSATGTVAGGGGGSGTAAVAGDVTWIRRTYNSTSWTTPGGTHAATESATTNVPETSGPRNWTGAQVLADVQAWYANSSTNFGWILIGDENNDQSARRFSTRQHTTSSQRPVLSVTYTPPATNGACCNATTGNCTVVSSSFSCTIAGNSYQGNGTTCVPNPCPQPNGACCNGLGNCIVDDQAGCEAADRYWQGANTVCSPNPCPVLSGACCHNDASCTFVNALSCAFSGNGAAYQGDNVTCTAADCKWVLTPFQDPLPIPSIAVPTTGTAGGVAHYNMYIRQFNHQFHAQLPATPVWGYNDQYPGPTIEARENLQVTTTWINDLRVNGPGSAFRAFHVLPVDQCLHGPDVTGRTPVTVTHLHGAHLRPDSDGDPDTAFAPGQTSTLYTYPNNQHGATLWYHDHALGLTRLNVYMGLAGFYLIRDSIEDGLNLPSGHNEIPLVIQDRSFAAGGFLKYNASFTDHFFGDFAVVNGKVWPYLDVRQGKYRFRIVNGSNTRTWGLRLQGPAGGAALSVPAWQIGSDLGLLAAPVSLGGGVLRPSTVTIMPGERAEVVIDFSGYAAGSVITWVNTAPVPYPAGGDGPNISDVMQFRVIGTPGDTAPLPATLKSVPRTPEAEATITRDFKLNKIAETICNHDMWQINGLMWDDITEFPKLGDTEIWRWVNQSGVSHPMHMHLVEFQVLDRDTFTIGAGGEVIPDGTPTLPPTWERGWKDTVQASPQQVTRVIARFADYPGTFPYHCHILDHEDHEMMRQFTVGCKAMSVIGGVGAVQANTGQTVSLTAAGVGSPPFTYQWRKNNVTVVNGPTGFGSTITGADTFNLVIINTRLSDAGLYNCVVTNPCGVQATSAGRQLTVFCLADYNHNGVINVQDIFDFLSGWFAGAASADINGNHVIEVQDIFDFLAAWFAGC